MAKKTYKDSNYRFTEPIRLFKANDPYYFEVDNIPLKQLQENCMWLRDQLKKEVDNAEDVLEVRRTNLEELKPFATGGDRLVRVNPGRYTARVNDATSKQPLAYLQKVFGEALGDVDAWAAASPAVGASFKDGANLVLEAALDSFKSSVAEDALGMNGLAERAFTWPVVNVDTPVGGTGASVESSTDLSFTDTNNPGSFANKAPFPIAEVLLWAKNTNNDTSFPLLSFDTAYPSQGGFANLPVTESYFIKAWRGVSRLAVVDVSEELSVEVPAFDSSNFDYVDEAGNTQSVNNVQSRIDLVFIYSKPVDASSANIIKDGQVQTITKPTLGIVRGAGIKADLQEKAVDSIQGLLSKSGDSILAHPADQNAENTGFISTSGNDIVQDVKGSFPAPDDLLNLAPLISEKLESTAYELVGQSILPVAYVFVQGDSQVVGASDVVDIRPLFRTAELAYNERAGISAAFPQLSLANPAVGKAQLDREVNKLAEALTGVQADLGSITSAGMNVAAAGYVFGGWNFGPEAVLLNHNLNLAGGEANFTEAEIQSYKDTIKNNYAYPLDATIPAYPDWDVASWVSESGLPNPGNYPNDYINTVRTTNVIAGSKSEGVNPVNGLDFGGSIASNIDEDNDSQFYVLSKKIFFQRPENMLDYKIDVNFVNCVSQTFNSFSVGDSPSNSSVTAASDELKKGAYTGPWVEKGRTTTGLDYFTIYIAVRLDGDTPAPNQFDQGLSVDKEAEREGAKYSGFLVGVENIFKTNITATDSYYRVGRCTVPTIMWSMTAIGSTKSNFLHTNLSESNVITVDLKGY